MVMVSDSPRVVIIGAGFGGLWAARTLAGSSADVTLLDRNNYHTFHALLYQVAAAELEPSDISHPIRSILRKMPNVNFTMAEVESIDFASREVKTGNGSIPYDYLVWATGSRSRFYGVEGAAEHAFQLKSLDDAIALRNHILCCLEEAARETSPERRQQLLTFAIVGGGPTGVELSGALAELIRGPIRKDYPSIDTKKIKVMLLEAADTVLSGMPPRLQGYTVKQLKKMGIDVQLNTVVSEITGSGLRLQDGSTIPCETVVWVAGVCGDAMAESCGLPIAADGRVHTLPTLQVPDYQEVYIVGDLAYVEKDGRPLPYVAPVAMQAGTAAAQNIKRQIAGQEPLPFRYRDKGSMATIGRKSAVVRIRKYEFTGYIAWVLWLAIHVFNLIGFRNRILVMINWAWDYAWHERAVRLILPSETCSVKKSYHI